MIERDVFTSGAYVAHFKPDHAHNPFHGIYGTKRDDILATVGALLAPGSTVLDLGGGMGRISVPLAQQFKVTLCDISPDMLRLAATAACESHVPQGHFATRCVNAADALPFPTASFDGALSIDLLVHLPDPVAALRELHRVLKPDGVLLVDMTNGAPAWILRYPRYVGRRPRLRRWWQTWQGGGVLPEWRGIVRHYTHAQFHTMLAAADFVVEQEWQYGPGWCPKWFLARCRRRER